MTTSKISRRAFSCGMATMAITPALSALKPREAWAEAFPSRPLKLVVGFPAGGPTDVVARLVAEAMSRDLGRQIVVENIGGAGGNLGAQSVARAAADGYTLHLATAGTHGINQWLYKSVGYDHLKDFAAVGYIGSAPNIVVVHPKLGARTFDEFIAVARSRMLNVAIAGWGTTPHMTGELLKATAGVSFQYVTYRGGGPALNDLIAGHVDVMIDAVLTSAQFVKEGHIIGLAVSSRTRSAILPDIPTISETLPGFEAIAWWGLSVPAKTDPAIVTLLNSKLNAQLQAPELVTRLEELGVHAEPSTPDAFATFVERETRKWQEVVAKTSTSIQ